MTRINADMSDTPFFDVPTNPYSSSDFDNSASQFTPFTRKQSRDRLLVLAVALGTLTSLWGATVLLILFSLFELAPLRLNDPGDQVNQVFAAIAVSWIVLLAPVTLMFVGSVQMVRVRGLFWCWAGVIAATLPLTPLFPLTLPLGIRLIAILKDPRVGSSFHDEVNFHTLP